MVQLKKYKQFKMEYLTTKEKFRGKKGKVTFEASTENDVKFRIDCHLKKVEAEKEELKRKKSLKFEFVLPEPEYLKEPLKAINKFTSEVCFKVTKKGVSIIGVDPANVCMYMFELSKNCFSTFKYSGESSFNVNISTMNNLLKKCKTTSVLSIKRSELDKDSLCMDILDESKCSYKMNIYESDDRYYKKIPELEFGVRLKLKRRNFFDSIGKAELCSGSVVFSVEVKKGLSLHADDDEGLSFNGEVSVEGDIAKDFKTKYSIEYLKLMNATGINDRPVLEFEKDYPLKITYELKDKLTLAFILAPRIDG
jgi:DNA polymerase III sliding clamp (beta) subunit (PCNA family)